MCDTTRVLNIEKFKGIDSCFVLGNSYQIATKKFNTNIILIQSYRLKQNIKKKRPIFGKLKRDFLNKKISETNLIALFK